MEINLFNLLLRQGDDFRVQLDNKILKEIRSKLTDNDRNLPAYAIEELDLHPQTLKRFLRGDTETGNIRIVKKLCNDSNIKRERLSNHINGFLARGSHRGVCQIPQTLTVDEQFLEGYALYIAEGDFGTNGELEPKKVRFTNADAEVCNVFINWLKAYFPPVEFVCKVDIPQNKSVTETRKREIRQSLETEHIEFRAASQPKQKKFVYRVWADNIILSRIIQELESYAKRRALEGSQFAAAYIRGMMMGEGTARVDEYERYVRIEMKNKPEISFISTLMTRLDIFHRRYKRGDGSGRYWIHIGTSQDLKRFSDMVGFGAHSRRQEVLDQCLSSYDEHHFRKGFAKLRFLQAIEALNTNGEENIRSVDIAELLGKSQTNARQTLLDLQNEGLVEREKDGYEYLYDLTGKGRDRLEQSEAPQRPNWLVPVHE